MSKLITLLSDFGSQDVYVGVMKGIIAQINPQITTIDLSHQIPPQNIAAGRFCLMSAYSYFPADTVHVAVVDPGVGSQRRGVAIQLAEGYLVGPDNGLLSGVLNSSTPVAAVELTNPVYWRSPTPSATFHGRDIFAPAGTHLASGVPLEKLGNQIDPNSLVHISMPEYRQTATNIIGCIQYIDTFGNLITNVPAAAVAGKTWSVMAGELNIPSGYAYSDRMAGDIVALVGSHGWVEIAVNGGSAKSRLQLDWEAPIKVLLSEDID